MFYKRHRNRLAIGLSIDIIGFSSKGCLYGTGIAVPGGDLWARLA